MNAQQFLGQMAATANTLDREEHMNLISKDVNVFAVPGLDVIGQTPDKIVFKSIDSVDGEDGVIETSGIRRGAL